MWMIAGATFLFLASATVDERLFKLTEETAERRLEVLERRREDVILPGDIHVLPGMGHRHTAWPGYTRYDDRNCETRGVREGPDGQSVSECMARCTEAEDCLGFSRSHRGRTGRCYLHTTSCVLSSRANYASSYDTYIKFAMCDSIDAGEVEAFCDVWGLGLVDAPDLVECAGPFCSKDVDVEACCKPPPVPSATYTRHEDRNCVTRGTKTGPDGQSVEECMKRCSPDGQSEAAQQARNECLGFSLSHSGATGRCYLHTTSCVLHPRKNYGYLYDTYLKDEFDLEREVEFTADEWQSAEGRCTPQNGRPPHCRTDYGNNGQHNTMTLSRCRTLAHDIGGIGYAYKDGGTGSLASFRRNCEVYFGPEITTCPDGDITRLPYRTAGSLSRINHPGSLANIPAPLNGLSRQELVSIPAGYPDRETIAKGNFGPYVTWTMNWQLGQDFGPISGGDGNSDWICYYPHLTAIGSS